MQVCGNFLPSDCNRAQSRGHSEQLSLVTSLGLHRVTMNEISEPLKVVLKSFLIDREIDSDAQCPKRLFHIIAIFCKVL